MPAVAPAAPHTTVQAIGTLITAFTAIGALVFTGLSLNATRAQVEVTQQGQYTDRYTKAVEQLDQTGPEHLQTRLGGIYALQRLTRDSPRDQPTIVNVLVTFITSTIQRANPTTSCPDRIAPDTQAALTVLNERDREHDAHTSPDSRMRLLGGCLADSQLAGAYLTEADLGGTDLIEANLTEADLTEAYLTRAYLTRVNLRGANLAGADLRWADLIEADLTAAYLTGANLRGADLAGADLTGADLRGAHLADTNHDSKNQRRRGDHRFRDDRKMVVTDEAVGSEHPRKAVAGTELPARAGYQHVMTRLRASTADQLDNSWEGQPRRDGLTDLGKQPRANLVFPGHRGWSR